MKTKIKRSSNAKSTKKTPTVKVRISRGRVRITSGKGVK